MLADSQTNNNTGLHEGSGWLLGSNIHFLFSDRKWLSPILSPPPPPPPPPPFSLYRGSGNETRGSSLIAKTSTCLLLFPSFSMTVMTGTQLSLCLRELKALLCGSSISSPYSVLTRVACSCGASSCSRRKAKMGDSISWTRESISFSKLAVISMSANFCTRLEA